MKIDRLAALFVSLFVGFIAGFDIAWILMKIPRVDMAMNTGVFIPVGLFLALIGGAVITYTNAAKIPRPALILAILVFVGLTLFVLASLLANPKAASTVAPILIREGFGWFR